MGAAIMVLCTTHTVSAFGPGSQYDTQVTTTDDPMAVDPAVIDYLKQQNLSSADGPHLWFYWINTMGNPELCARTGQCRCGDIGAAARMPAELFKPQSILALARYAALTIKSYSSLGMGNQTLKLGRCKQKTNYVCGPSGVQGINWVNNALVKPICKKQCDCNYPACRDQPDDPAAGKFCSLCGPKYNGYITINLWNIPNSDDDDSGTYGPCSELLSGNIVETIQSNPDLSTLYTALKAADLFGALTAPGPWTLFAPTNKAFAALPPRTLANLLKPKNKALLVEVLTYHVKPDSMCTKKDDSTRYCSRTFKDGDSLRTVEGKSVEVHQSYFGRPPYQSKVMINSATIVTADVRAQGNSVIQIIARVLEVPSNIVDIAATTPDLSTLVTAVNAADLVRTLSSTGPFTVFAPTNEAFNALPAGAVANLPKPENKADLVSLLTYHVVAGAVLAKDLKDRQVIKTVQGETLTVRVLAGNLFKPRTVFINSAKVTTADVGASNGVVHIIDGVLLPAP